MMDRIWIVIILAAGISALMGFSYTTFAYYPKLAHDRDIGQTEVGLLFGSNSLAFMLLSLISPMMIRKFGRKQWLLVSLFVSGLAVFLFAWLSFINNKPLFLVISMICKLVTGGTMSLYMTTAYSFVAILYKENVSKGIGRIQSAIGIGPIIWLVSSSLIFKWFGYFITFTVLSLVFGVICLAIFIWVHNFQVESQESHETKPIKSKYIFFDWRIIGVFISAGIAMTLINAPASLVADRFEDFDMPEWLKGLTFLFSNIPFTIVSLLLHKISTLETVNKAKSIKLKQTVIWSGYVLLWVGFLLIGPSLTLHFPQKVWIILLGFVFFGTSYAALIVSNIPLLHDYAIQFDTVEGEFNNIMNYISALFNLWFGFGSFLGPLISPSIKDLLGYNTFTDLFSLFAIIGLMIFLILSWMPLSKYLSTHFIRNSDESSINKSPTIIDQFSEKDAMIDLPLISK